MALLVFGDFLIINIMPLLVKEKLNRSTDTSDAMITFRLRFIIIIIRLIKRQSEIVYKFHFVKKKHIIMKWPQTELTTGDN